MARSPQLRRARSGDSTGAHIFGASLSDADNLVCEGCDPGAPHRQAGLPASHTFASANRSAYRYQISGMKIWAVLLVALASASPVVAQEPTPPLVPEHSQSVLETLMKAGPVIIPLFLLSIFFVMLVVVYLLTIRRGAVVSSGYMATADALLRKRDYLGLLAVSNRHGEAIARV